jgi:RNA polymerase sigma factor (sigma-70 family)
VEGYTLTGRPLTAKRGPSPLLRLATDERLVTLTRRGDQAAFEVLVARYQVRLLGFCRHMLKSREDAEDVLQEVFAAAFNALLADQRDINVRPWLYRIARNRCLNHLRRHTAIGVDSMDVHFAEMGISTGEKVFKREEFRVLVEDIGHLPETQRTAILLREMDGLSYEQVAQAMETTVAGVKSLLVRARIGLAEAAEARKLSCDAVRLELGAVAEGVSSLTPPVRRHLKDCERCHDFRSHLRANNRTLAALAPLGPLLVLKKLIATKLGAGAGGASATVGGGAAAAAAGGGATLAGAGSAGAFTATAVAAKAVADIAAAALLTAGAVAVDHARPATKRAGALYAVAPAGTPARSFKSRALGRGRGAQDTGLTVNTTGTPAIAAPTVGAAVIAPLVTPPAAAPTVTPTSEEVTTTTVFPGSTATGPSGPASGGVTGSSGSTATTGASGLTGSSGTTGTSGTSGTTGTSGSSGSSGATGTTAGESDNGATGSSGAASAP